MKHFIGIDNSTLDHKIRIVNENGNETMSFTVENTFYGFQKLEEKIHNLSEPVIGFELPHGPLIDYLHEKNYCLYSLNPLKIKRYKETLFVSGNKNDEIDALAIAEYLRHNESHSREMKFNSDSIEFLKHLAIIHSRLVQNRARHLNKLHFALRQYFPLHESLFSEVGCNVQLKMLQKYPTFKDLKKASEKEIKQFLIDNKYCRINYIEKLQSKIRNYRQYIPEEIEMAYQIEGDCLCKIIQTLKEKIQEIEKKMNTILDNHQLGECFRSFPGAGKVLACKLLALFGDNKDRFTDYNGVQCLFGTAPKNYQSGQYHKVNMRRSCNKSARAVLYKFAFSSMIKSQWARAYYDKQRKKGKTHSVAVRALSNKWVRVIYKIWKEEILYDEAIKFKKAS